MTYDKKILIVEDEEINRAILNEMFCHNYDVLEATNGLEALELIEQNKENIAVILLDIVMPVMDGVQFMEEMHRRDWIKDLPIVLITAEVSEKLSIQSYEFGISDVISKPFNPYIVKLRVGNIIELYNYREDLEKVVQEQTIELQIQAEKLRQSNSFFIEALNTAVEFRDNESGMHIQRIRDITRLFLYMVSDRYPEYRFLQEDADLICDAAAMHDIGKIAIPDAILLKPGKLTQEEFEIMKTHSIKGCEILDKLNGIENKQLLSYCYDICRHHHERWDGKGYPDGLSGNNISIWAQIVSIADVYDALVSIRVYKAARSHEEALKMILNGECGTFNPMLLECLQDIAGLLKQAYEDGEAALGRVNARIDDDNSHEAEAFQNGNPTSRMMRLLETERKKNRTGADNTVDILLEYNRKTDVLLFEKRFQDIFGVGPEFVNVQKSFLDESFVLPESKADMQDIMAFLKEPGQTMRGRLKLRAADGSSSWYGIYLHALWEPAGDQMICEHIMGKVKTIDEATQSTAWKTAEIDELTGLYDAAGFRKLDKVLFADTDKLRVCYYIDINGLKEVNDSLGHLSGDHLLAHIAKRIKSCFRTTDVIGRVGGDEFAVFAVDLPQHLVVMKAEKLCNIFREEFIFDDMSLMISASVGIAYYPTDAVNCDDLLKCAEEAMDNAKKKGKNRYAFFKS